MNLSLVFAFVLAILVNYRIARLITFDGLTDAFRGRVAKYASSENELLFIKNLQTKLDEHDPRFLRRMRFYYWFSSNLLYFVNCPFCVGVWVGVCLGALICYFYGISNPLEIGLICFGVPGGQAALDEIFTVYRSQ